MKSHDQHHGRRGTWRAIIQMMLGCCLAFLLLIAVAPFAGAWGIVLVLVALLGCVLMAALHRGPSREWRWFPGQRRDPGSS